ncbi:septum formation family protein [Corynebacterium choanae]|nr:septum formation family protein [Corynebacterium choanae]
MGRKQVWRSSAVVNSVLVVALGAAAAVGAYDYVRAQDTAPATVAEGTPGSTSTTGSITPTPVATAPSFTTAQPGDCVTWDVDDAGVMSNFRTIDCAVEHRFEVSARTDLSAFPSSEFGPKSQPPSVTRQAQLREQLCKNPTLEYVGGTFDPNGRYSISLILPQPTFWEAGDRTMLCGLQAPDDDGFPQITRGRVVDQDQSRAAAVGQCIFVDQANATKIVDCANDHTLEITKVVDLREHFPDRTPSIEEQDALLRPLCQQAAIDYLGGDDPLYYSTLEFFWTVVQPRSWEGGSRTANCALVKNVDGGFATLQGSATGPFTINGNPPPPQPERRPLRNNPPAGDTPPAPQ